MSGKSGTCEHNRPRHICKQCGGSSICQHGRQKHVCRDCGGTSFCEHDKPRNVCKECKGSSICEHNRLKHQCIDCGGSSICEHKKLRYFCKDCKGSSLCEHGKRRHFCKDCRGPGICEHNRQRHVCKECGGSSICPHGKRKDHCKECCGSAICEHNRQKYYCKECKGAGVCQHGKRRNGCKECRGSSPGKQKKKGPTKKLQAENTPAVLNTLNPSGSAHAQEVLPGQRVSVCFRDDKWYAGTVVNVTPGQWAKVSFDDDDSFHTVQFPDPNFKLLPSRKSPSAPGKASRGVHAGHAVVSSKPSNKHQQGKSVDNKKEDEGMLQGELNQELVGGGRRRVRKEEGNARDRAEARMLEAAIRASLEASGGEEEEGADAARDYPSSSILVSAQVDQDRGQTQQLASLSAGLEGGTVSILAASGARAAVARDTGYGPSTTAVLAAVAGLSSGNALGAIENGGQQVGAPKRIAAMYNDENPTDSGQDDGWQKDNITGQNKDNTGQSLSGMSRLESVIGGDGGGSVRKLFTKRTTESETCKAKAKLKRIDGEETMEGKIEEGQPVEQIGEEASGGGRGRERSASRREGKEEGEGRGEGNGKRSRMESGRWVQTDGEKPEEETEKEAAAGGEQKESGLREVGPGIRGTEDSGGTCREEEYAGEDCLGARVMEEAAELLRLVRGRCNNSRGEDDQLRET